MNAFDAIFALGTTLMVGASTFVSYVHEPVLVPETEVLGAYEAPAEAPYATHTTEFNNTYVTVEGSAMIAYIRHALDSMREDVNDNVDEAVDRIDEGIQNITSESLEDLLDVTDALTKDVGDLLYWDGGSWSDIATSSLEVALSDTTGTLATVRGGTGQTTYAVGDVLYADTTTTLARLPLGSNGQVLKVTGGVPAWGADATGGGGAGAFATSSDNLLIYPTDASDVIVFGASATSTTGNTFEVEGNVLFRDALTTYGVVTAPRFIATSTSLPNTFPQAVFTTATTTNFIINSETFTDLTGTGLQNIGGALTLNATGDWTGTFDGQEGDWYKANSFSTTSADVWQTQRNFFSTTSADYLATQRDFFSTSSALAFNISVRDWSILSGALSPTTTLGIGVYASSTIGNGNQNGGLTISGGATTTGSLYVAGSVGIGTAAPETTLDVQGGNILLDNNTFIQFEGSGGSNNNVLSMNGSNNVLLNTVAGTSILFQDGATTNVTITGAGDMGVGTTSPYARLSVHGMPGSGTTLFNISSSTLTATTSLFSVDTSGNATLLNRLTAPYASTTSFTASASVYLATNGGSVGIGTSSPAAEFNVYANNSNNTDVLIEAAIDNAILVISADTTNTAAGGNQDPILDFYSANTRRARIAYDEDANFLSLGVSGAGLTENLVVNTSGFVGIGTTSPSEIFNVYRSGSNINLATFENPSTGTSGAADIELIASSTSAILKVYNAAYSAGSGVLASSTYLAQTAGSGGLILGTEVAAPIRFTTNGFANERMRITSAGKVGIGTTSPLGLLTIFGGSDYASAANTPLIYVASSSAGLATTTLFAVQASGSFDLGGESTGGPSILGFDNNVSTFALGGSLFLDTGRAVAGLADINLRTDDGSGLGTRLVVKNGGNVGIGTTSPSYLLGIDGNNNTLELAATSPAMRLSAGGGKSWVVQAVNADRFRVNEDGTTEVFTIDPGGNVGIGDATPTEANLVVGSAGAGTVFLTLSTAGTTNNAVCWDNAGATLLYDCDSTPADYAESYPTENNVEFGDIVMTTTAYVGDKNGEISPKLAKAVAGEGAPLGIVSNNYHDFTSAGKDLFAPEHHPLPVALNGRVPVKVNNEGGEIRQGDRIALSSVPGVGKKATESGLTVGIALEDAHNGQVLVFVQNEHHFSSKDVAFLSLLASSTAPVSEENTSILGSLFNRIATWMGDAGNSIGEFFANRIHTKEVCVSDETGETCITKAQLDALLSGQDIPLDDGSGEEVPPTEEPPQEQPPVEEPPTEDPQTDGPTTEQPPEPTVVPEPASEIQPTTPTE